MTLKEYLSEENITQTEFIKRIQRSTGNVMPQGTLAKYIIGTRIPRKKEMNIIFQATEGKVQPNDFFLLCE